MKNKLNISLLVVALFLFVLVIMQFILIDAYIDNFKYNKHIIDEWHHRCDSILEKNAEICIRYIELQDSLIRLQLKED